MDRLPRTELHTHRVDNVPEPRLDYNPLRSDAALRDAVQREGASWANDRLERLGASVGAEPYLDAAALAHEHPPVLHAFDAAGRRVDALRLHPAHHELMGLGMAYWLPGLPWAEPRRGAHVAHAAMVYLMAQLDAGVVEPMTTSYAAVPTLRAQPQVARVWEHRLLAATYDPRDIPASGKDGVMMGLALTEKHAGSDLSGITTRATAINAVGPGHAYTLHGHKWFCSAPMADAWLTLATTDAGPTCFIVPRWRPDGRRNPLAFQRLKPTLGARTGALVEVEYRDTWAQMIGDPGRGLATLAPMVHHCSLDAAVTPVAVMRQALGQALHHATQRRAFGRALIDQPLMRAVLADLALELEAAVALVMRVARSFDDARHDPSASATSRLLVALAGAWIHQRAPEHVAESLACLGGYGTVEAGPLPRLYRQAASPGLFGSSGNAACLRVQQIIEHEPECLGMLLDELAPCAAVEPTVASRIEAAGSMLRHSPLRPSDARRLVDTLVVAIEAALLFEHGPTDVARAFVAARLRRRGAHTYGSMPAGLAIDALLQRAGATNP